MEKSAEHQVFAIRRRRRHFNTVLNKICNFPNIVIWGDGGRNLFCHSTLPANNIQVLEEGEGVVSGMDPHVKENCQTKYGDTPPILLVCTDFELWKEWSVLSNCVQLCWVGLSPGESLQIFSANLVSADQPLLQPGGQSCGIGNTVRRLYLTLYYSVWRTNVVVRKELPRPHYCVNRCEKNEHRKNIKLSSSYKVTTVKPWPNLEWPNLERLNLERLNVERANLEWPNLEWLNLEFDRTSNDRSSKVTEPRITEPRKGPNLEKDPTSNWTEPRMTEHRNGLNLERPNLEWDRTSKME
jgi:hypothetical protein